MDLSKNKIAAAVLITGLMVMGLKELAHFVVSPPHGEAHAEAGAEGEAHAKAFGYKIEVSGSTVPGEGEAAAAEGPRDYYTLMMAADPAAGEVVAAKCLQCHKFEKGGAALQGPPLYGIVGRDIASLASFKYSAGENGLEAVPGVWDYEKLDKFLERPKAYVTGTAMSFVGIKKEKDRADLIAYLRSLADPGAEMAMPAPLPAAAVVDPAAVPADGAAVPADGAAPVEGAPATPGAPAATPTPAASPTP